MKRKGGFPLEPQQGACDVWLDASALKKRRVQTRTPFRVLSQRSSYFPPTRLPVTCTKQTTISTFFSALPAGERTSTSQRLLPAVSSSAPLPKRRKLPQLEKQAQDLCYPQLASAPALSDAGMEREIPVEGEDLLPLDCIRPLQEKELFEQSGVAISPLRERNIAQRSWKNKNQQPFQPAAVQMESREGLVSSWRDRCLTEAAESENVDPQLKGCRTAAGLCVRPKSEVCKSSYGGHKESQAELPVLLFSQDSEGHKVISHHFVRERGKLPLQKKSLWNQGSPSAGLLETSQQLHYNSLFTEDSEGNRIIRH